MYEFSLYRCIRGAETASDIQIVRLSQNGKPATASQWLAGEMETRCAFCFGPHWCRFVGPCPSSAPSPSHRISHRINLGG